MVTKKSTPTWSDVKTKLTDFDRAGHHLAHDLQRTEAICHEIAVTFGQGRKVLVLTERTEHLDAILAGLTGKVPSVFVLHGRMSKKQRAAVIKELDALPPDSPRILLATGKLVGAGFDHPPLDTLVLAMPVSCKGMLQQYAGRLHRKRATKTDVRIVDFVDSGHPAAANVGQAATRIQGDGLQNRKPIRTGWTGVRGITQWLK